MVKLTTYGGVFEIGGNKILLQDRGTRVFLDFGVSFSSEAKYFNGGIAARGVNGVGDYLEFDLLPRLEGLYAEEQIKPTTIPYKSPEYQGILISHAHIDHVGHTDFLDESIPIYCGETCKRILSALEESSAYKYNLASTRCFRTGDKIRIDDIEIEPIHVDHSIPGAYGFIIHTSEGCVVYTGDLRVHGTAAHMTEDFISKAEGERPLVLLCEGTRVEQKEQHKLHSELEVRNNASEVVANSSKLIATSFYGRDIDRLNTFYSIAVANHRKFAIPLKTALLLSKLKGDIHLKIPDVGHDDNVLIYKKRKKSGTYDKKDYFNWERQFLDTAVDHKWIHENQSKIILAIEPRDFTELIDIRPEAGGHFIYSMSEAYTEVEAVNDEVQKNWLNHFKIEFHQIHASGHAPPEEIGMIIKRIKPKTVIPIHTEHPEKFQELIPKDSSRIVILRISESYNMP
ncbi:MAG: MBL fold metallo-hydrolase [Candidatus Atabeyarchaeum deiterrae]